MWWFIRITLLAFVTHSGDSEEQTFLQHCQEYMGTIPQMPSQESRQEKNNLLEFCSCDR